MAEEEKIVIRKRNGYTIIEKAVVGMPLGLCTRTLMNLVDEFEKYSRRIEIERIEPFNPRAEVIRINAKSRVQLLRLAAIQGTGLRLFVEGEDADAERYVLRLYSRITSKEDFNPDFDRYQKRDVALHL